MFQRIRDLREDHDLTQEQVAQILCVKQATYSRYESGAINVPVDVLIKLASFYQTSVDYILGLTNDPTAK
ncbi:MAG: helix-turn-helix domain-containing protein [Negativibacillus massiliensis]|mgnify:FL=1|nr:helix-turn-helix domain-containing protein [Negativibacillus massiliensis]